LFSDLRDFFGDVCVHFPCYFFDLMIHTALNRLIHFRDRLAVYSVEESVAFSVDHDCFVSILHTRPLITLKNHLQRHYLNLL
jgi:hypothetical protein